MIRFIGVDYGTKRIGLSVGDDEARVAVPLTMVPACGERKKDALAVMAAAGAVSMGRGSLNYGLFIKPMGDELGIGRSSRMVTMMFDGFRSRWMIPFWCACWTARQTSMNSSSRPSVESF